MTHAPKSPDALETIAVLALASLVFGMFLDTRVLFYAAAFLLCIGIFFKGIAGRIASVWLRFAAVLGTVNTTILLSIVFFLILSPVAFVYRIVHGDQLRLKRKNPLPETYWSERAHVYEKKDLDKPW